MIPGARAILKSALNYILVQSIASELHIQNTIISNFGFKLCVYFLNNIINILRTGGFPHDKLNLNNCQQACTHTHRTGTCVQNIINYIDYVYKARHTC